MAITLDDIRKTKTSDLLCLLNPDVMIAAIGDAEVNQEQLKVLYVAIAAEIDRRIPVPA
jgi:hypothetical protein